MKRTLTAITLIVAVLLASGAATASVYSKYRLSGEANTQFEIRGGVIRFAPGTVGQDGVPYIHANAAHVSVGLVDVYVEDDGDLVVVTDGTSPIVSAWASADETLSSRGIFCGASVGGSTSVFRCYKDNVGRLYLDQQDDWDLIAGSLSNLWIGWVSVAQ